ncbi:mitochondrial dicarboxylate carrier-like [Calliphora vicina]|uniref:mitochondrial dicarboxylate carrier-like n=1 Tax=Calliphora vicina TaxID=7373 RepID=UPI00325B885D
MENEKRINRWYFGGISSATAVSVTHPLDLIKVHLQTQQLPRKTLVETIGHIYAAGGLKGFYRGMSASLLRQLTYTTTRFGIYESGKQYIDFRNIGQTLALATTAGFCGGVVGVPTDMVNVRMQNDSKLPKEKQRGYKHVFDGLYRVTKEEGVQALFRGGSAAVLRGVMMTIGQNAVYDYLKCFLLKTKYFKDNSLTHFLTSLISGGVGTLCTQPLDVMKTRLMNAKPGQYSGLLAVAKDISSVGPIGFFKGFIPAFARIGPHTILTFLLMEQLRLHFGYFPPTASA